MKYFAQVVPEGEVPSVPSGVLCVIRQNGREERFDWLTQKWIEDDAARNAFWEKSGAGGNGFDWYEVTEEEATALIRKRTGHTPDIN